MRHEGSLNFSPCWRRWRAAKFTLAAYFPSPCKGEAGRGGRLYSKSTPTPPSPFQGEGEEKRRIRSFGLE